MKITKRQLKRIIKEEKAKLLHETVADMRHMEEAADQAASGISDLFGQDMMKLYDEEPEAFARPDPNGTGMIRDSIEVWEEQVGYAQQELDTSISFAIAKAIEEVEMKLHDGQYFDPRGR